MRVIGWQTRDVRLFEDSEREFPGDAIAGFVEAEDVFCRYRGRVTFTYTDENGKLSVASAVCQHRHRSWVAGKGCAAHLVADIQQLCALRRAAEINEPPGG